jgi:hypothetical protein
MKCQETAKGILFFCCLYVKKRIIHNFPKRQIDFSSPELKTQANFSDRLLSVCLLDFYTFNFFSRTTGQISTTLDKNHSWKEGIKVFQMKGIAPLQEEMIANKK